MVETKQDVAAVATPHIRIIPRRRHPMKRSLYPIWMGSWRGHRVQQGARPAGWDVSSSGSLHICGEVTSVGLVVTGCGGFSAQTRLVCAASSFELGGNPQQSPFWKHPAPHSVHSCSSAGCPDFQCQSLCHVSGSPEAQGTVKLTQESR